MAERAWKDNNTLRETQYTDIKEVYIDKLNRILAQIGEVLDENNATLDWSPADGIGIETPNFHAYFEVAEDGTFKLNPNGIMIYE